MIAMSSLCECSLASAESSNAQNDALAVCADRKHWQLWNAGMRSWLNRAGHNELTVQHKVQATPMQRQGIPAATQSPSKGADILLVLNL